MLGTSGRGGKLLERLMTRQLPATVTCAILVLLMVLTALLVFTSATIEQIGGIVDISLKVIASIVGGAWALNRYFMARTDELQLRIDADVQAIPAGSFKETPDLSLLIARLDIVNTGKTLMPTFEHRLLINGVFPARDGVKEVALYRWPEMGLHLGGPIEPGSWSAINISHSIPGSTLAVRVYVEIYLMSVLRWTWHKTLRLTE